MAGGTVVVNCGFCGDALTDIRGLRKHQSRMHQNEAPFPCGHCPRRFFDRRGLETHCGYKHPEVYVQRRKYPDAHRNWNLRAKYGITLVDYNLLLAAQGGTCATCDATTGDSRGRSLHVDHDHASGEVRGLLCSNCNTAIGKAGDDPVHLRRLADYLEGR